MREFLLFAGEHCGHTFEQTLDRFLEAIGERVGIKPRQSCQAADAARIYRYQYRATNEHGAAGTSSDGSFITDEKSLLSRLREVIRLRHYARRVRGDVRNI